MRISHILMLVLFSVGMGLGQLLLKFSALQQNDAGAGFVVRLVTLFTDWTFLLAATFYGLLLIFWVWLLTFLPLSRAYPFTILSFIVATTGSAIFFNEQMSRTMVAGLALIGLGLIVLSTDTSGGL